MKNIFNAVISYIKEAIHADMELRKAVLSGWRDLILGKKNKNE